MSYPVRTRPQADRELAEIVEHIASENLEAALLVGDAVEEAFTLLSKHPEVGTRHPARSDRLAGLRRWVVPRYPNFLVFYIFDGEFVDVLHIFRGEMDYDKRLRDDGE